MKVTLKDVAKASGVSVSTVSRVINGDRERPASSETSEKIWEIVQTLGYVPNQCAMKLVKGEAEESTGKKRIACIYRSISDVKTDPFFSCIGIGIQGELRKKGYEMAFALSSSHMTYCEVYNYLTSQAAEGIIVVGQVDEAIQALLKVQFKHIVYAGVNTHQTGFDEVICDGYNGARCALNHLLDMGHKRIGFLGCVLDQVAPIQPVNGECYRAYCDVLKEETFPYRAEDAVHTRLYTTAAYEAMMTYIDRRPRADLPTAFCCANDATAFGAMKALQVMGLRIPEDIAIIGLDDVEMARFVTPTLSTVSIPRKSLGIQAVNVLIEQIESGRTYPLRVDLSFDLKIRESSNYKR